MSIILIISFRIPPSGNNKKICRDKEESVTYNTVQECIDSLNKNVNWINCDITTNTATITSVEDFVINCKSVSKNVGAFDDLESIQGENILFGYGYGKSTHFDSIMTELLKDTEYGEA